MKLVETNIGSWPAVPDRAQIGLVALASDRMMERDFWRMAVKAEVEIFTTRILLRQPLTVETLGELEGRISDAVKLIPPEATAVVFGCTSATAVIGADAVERRVHEVSPDVAVTNPGSAAIAALAHLGARRAALVAPYSREVSEQAARFFEAGGVTLADKAYFGLDTDRDLSIPTPEHYLHAVRQLDLADTDAVFISCTGVQALDAVAAIEAEIGIPVVTSNQASFWHATRLAGAPVQIEGFGRLMQAA